MDILKALILGVIEGVTEFLPISSTGHLLIAEDLLKFKDASSLFTVIIQLGAIAAAAWYFKDDLVQLVKDLGKKDKATQSFVLKVFVGLLPAGVAGLVIEKTTGIPTSVTLTAITLIIGGAALWLAEHYIGEKKPAKGEELKKITLKQSIAVGMFQCLSLVPGVSRSGSTIIGGLLSGLDRKTATAYSFYLSLPLMLVASLYKFIDDRSALNTISGGNTALIVGLVTAAITAFIAVKWLLKYVQNHSFKAFAYYRIVLGVLILLFLSSRD